MSSGADDVKEQTIPERDFRRSKEAIEKAAQRARLDRDAPHAPVKQWNENGAFGTASPYVCILYSTLLPNCTL